MKGDDGAFTTNVNEFIILLFHVTPGCSWFGASPVDAVVARAKQLTVQKMSVQQRLFSCCLKNNCIGLC